VQEADVSIERQTHNPYGTGRLTPQRRMLAEVAAEQRAFTVEDLAAELAARTESVGLATVYRAVTALESAGSIERIGERGGSSLYAWCGSAEHHHHLVCTECGVVETAPCPFEVQPLEATPGGFQVTRHEMTLYGVCPVCARTDTHSRQTRG